jgi:hypothetical protein
VSTYTDVISGAAIAEPEESSDEDAGAEK